MYRKLYVYSAGLSSASSNITLQRTPGKRGAAHTVAPAVHVIISDTYYHNDFSRDTYRTWFQPPACRRRAPDAAFVHD